MAVADNNQNQSPTPPASDPPADETPKKVAKQERRADETVPGGRYKIGDKFVNANGEEVK